MKEGCMIADDERRLEMDSIISQLIPSCREMKVVVDNARSHIPNRAKNPSTSKSIQTMTTTTTTSQYIRTSQEQQKMMIDEVLARSTFKSFDRWDSSSTTTTATTTTTSTEALTSILRKAAMRRSATKPPKHPQRRTFPLNESPTNSPPRQSDRVVMGRTIA